MERKNFNEELKKQEQEARVAGAGKTTLDDTQRVKVLSPGRLVFKRFMRNKLAIAGSVILIFMFVFAFIGALIYPYSQTEIFYKFDHVTVDYANASVRTEYTMLGVDDSVNISATLKGRLNAAIVSMDGKDLDTGSVMDSDGNAYVIRKIQDKIYAADQAELTEICSKKGARKVGTYDGLGKKVTFNDNAGDMDADGFTEAVKNAVAADTLTFSYDGTDYELTPGKKKQYTIQALGDGSLHYAGTKPGAGFEDALEKNMAAGSFELDGKSYMISKNGEDFTVYQLGKAVPAIYATTYVFDAYGDAGLITDEFKLSALSALESGDAFEAGGQSYTIAQENGENVIYSQADSESPVAVLSSLVIRASDGTDSLSFEFKDQVRKVINEMSEQKNLSTKFEFDLPKLGEGGKAELDENGNVVLEPTTINIKNKNGSYLMTCEQLTYLIDIFAAPSTAHPFGTDADGMDVLARMMYGGRISLLVCFVVVILETLIGVILGGIAGFFGGWVDNLIMRLVDIFYCIPSMPILIIMGAYFDSIKMEPYVRLVWLMAILGILGWAGVARLVRGQILSLREQEFMVAAEAIGLRTKRRIFKHLVPNVMPQLIVTATNNLGGIIITESTLSFLGLGVKHPLATWGTMINSVTNSSENMIRYAYIWVPVGVLICLTVIAFNFVGDGLRDAFDPKMKR